MHRVGLATFSNPVIPCLQNNCTVFGAESETLQRLLVWIIPDLDPANLSLRHVDLKATPYVGKCLCTTISTIPQDELVLITITVSLVYGDKVIIVVELVYGWEVSVLRALESSQVWR